MLTLASLFLGGLPAAVSKARHWFDVTLADWWRMQHKFRGPGEAHGQSGSTHQNSCDPCNTKEKHDLFRGVTFNDDL